MSFKHNQASKLHWTARVCVFFPLFTDYVFVQAFQAFHFPPFREAIKHCIWGKKTNKQTHSHKCTVHMQRGEHKKKKKKKKKTGEEKRTHCLSNKILQSWKLQQWEGRVGFMVLYLARRSYTCTHTNTHTCTAEANTQTDVGVFLLNGIHLA